MNDRTEVRVDERPPQTGNPFGHRSLDTSVAAGTVEIESSRAVAEAQGKLVIAKKFPRDPFTAMQRILDACRRNSLADSSLYEYSRGGSKVRGPSIRLAEELARCWGNVEYGLRELSNRDGVSEMEAYAWDLETNTYSSQRFTVRHVRDTRSGSYDLTDQRDIYEATANQGARRMRARILAIIPDDVVEAAVRQCEETIKHGAGESMSVRIERLVGAFGRIGVAPHLIERRLGHPLADTLSEELVELGAIYESLRDNQSKRTDWFGCGAGDEPPPPVSDGRAERQPYSDTKFAELLPKWLEVISAGRKTADQIIAMAESKAILTDDQKKAIQEGDLSGAIEGLDEPESRAEETTA